MSTVKRVLRSSTIATTSSAPPPIPSDSPPNLYLEPIKVLSRNSKLPGLSSLELTLLRRKQKQLRLTASSILASLDEVTKTHSHFPSWAQAHVSNALSATFIFAQHEAGTAVCIDAAGWVLTCSHCFAETEEEWQAYTKKDKRKWLLCYTGLAVQVECRVWDGMRDLALCKVVVVEAEGRPLSKGKVPTFTFMPLSATVPEAGEPIVCIGQPGRDDLEAPGNKKTSYNLVEISKGVFRGMVKNADPHDNREIGALKHDAWTYWGHSGAPLLRRTDGELVGLHSSWDDWTAMRHGLWRLGGS